MNDAPRETIITPAKRRTSRWWLLGLVVYVGVVWYIGGNNVVAAFTEVYWPLLAGVMVIELSTEWLRVLKWRMVLGPGQQTIGLYYLSKGAAYFSPGRVGELAPLMLARHRTPRLGAWIFTDRILESGATLGLGAAGWLVLGVNQPGIFLMLCVAIAVLVLLPVYVVTRRHWFEWLERRCPSGGRLARLAGFITHISDAVRGMRRHVFWAAPMTVGLTALDLGGHILIYKAFGYDVSFPLIALALSLHGIVSALPFTPNASGIPYLAHAWVLRELGGVPGNILLVAMSAHVAIINLVFWTCFGFGATGLRSPRHGDNA